MLDDIVETIAKGKIVSEQTSGNRTQSRVLIGYNGHTALLSLSDGDKNTWLLTGWENFEDNKKETSIANGEGNGSTAATATTPMRSRRDGEDVSSVTSSVPPRSET